MTELRMERGMEMAIMTVDRQLPNSEIIKAVATQQQSLLANDLGAHSNIAYEGALIA